MISVPLDGFLLSRAELDTWLNHPSSSSRELGSEDSKRLLALCRGGMIALPSARVLPAASGSEEECDRYTGRPAAAPSSSEGQG